MVAITESKCSTGLRLDAQNVSWTIYIITIALNIVSVFFVTSKPFRLLQSEINK